MTGLTLISAELMGKRLELLKETLPHRSCLAFLTGPLGPLDQSGQSRHGLGEPALVVQGAKEAARLSGMRLHIPGSGNA